MDATITPLMVTLIELMVELNELMMVSTELMVELIECKNNYADGYSTKRLYFPNLRVLRIESA